LKVKIVCEKTNSGSRHGKPKNIVNAASDITYRPVIEADDTGRCTLII
jgi:hypothetical protein